MLQVKLLFKKHLYAHVSEVSKVSACLNKVAASYFQSSWSKNTIPESIQFLTSSYAKGKKPHKFHVTVTT